MRIEKNLQDTLKEIKDKLKTARGYNSESKRSYALQVMVQCNTVHAVIIHIPELNQLYDQFGELWEEANQLLNSSYQ